MSAFVFGMGRATITPPLGTWLVGYPERDHGCVGVHDDLYVKAWVFSDGQQAAALACLDVCIVDLELLARVREKVGRETGLKPHQIHLSYSHTHSGHASVPKGIDKVIMPEPDPELDAIMVRYVSGAIISAFRSLRPGRLGLGSGKVTGICSNRRDPKARMDPEVKVLRVEEQDGTLAGVIVNYACHPTVLHADNYLVSRDYPGYMCDTVERGLGDSVQVAFAQGAGADTSTRWTRRGMTFAEAARVGHILGGEVLRVLEAIETSPEVRVRCLARQVELPTRQLPRVEEAEQILARETERLERLRTSGAPYGEIQSAYVAQFGASLTASRARQPRPATVTTEVDLIWLGDIPIAVIPAESFARIGLDLKGALGEKTVVLGYANDCLGYLITPEEEAVGGYEVNSALMTASASEHLRDAVISLAKQPG